MSREKSSEQWSIFVNNVWTVVFRDGVNIVYKDVLSKVDRFALNLYFHPEENISAY